jgi:hypothetical protein
VTDHPLSRLQMLSRQPKYWFGFHPNCDNMLNASERAVPGSTGASAGTDPLPDDPESEPDDEDGDGW